MKKLLSVVIAAATFGITGQAMAAAQITGAGSSFIYPVLSKWAATYHKKTGVEINYQPIGSGGGLQQIYSHTVTFAASDMPLHKTQLTAKHLQQFPMIIGGIVPIVHIVGIQTNQLVLDGNVLAKIYEGKITYWNDPQIVALNPSLKGKLPHNRIVSVHRADGSGTTFNFTNYLDKVNSDWKLHIGSNTVVNWPGFGIGAKGNAGVASQVAHLPNAIGYVEYAYAKQNHLTVTKMKNAAGSVVTADADTFAAAAKNAHYHADNGFYLILTNQPGADSWPIVATTFVLVPTNSKHPKQVKQALRFFTWSYHHGKKAASQLDYVAIPKKVYKQVIKTWHK